MIRAIALSVLLLSVASCTPTLEPVAREGSLCDAAMPDWSDWDGKPLQLPQASTIYVCDDPTDPKRVLAIVADRDKIQVRLDIAREHIAVFFQSASGFLAGASPIAAGDRAGVESQREPITIKSIRCKGTTTIPVTQSGEQGSEQDGEVDPDNAAYFVYRTQAIHAAEEQAEADFASGKVCAPKAHGL